MDVATHIVKRRSRNESLITVSAPASKSTNTTSKYLQRDHVANGNVRSSPTEQRIFVSFWSSMSSMGQSNRLSNADRPSQGSCLSKGCSGRTAFLWVHRRFKVRQCCIFSDLVFGCRPSIESSCQYGWNNDSTYNSQHLPIHLYIDFGNASNVRKEREMTLCTRFFTNLRPKKPSSCISRAETARRTADWLGVLLYPTIRAILCRIDYFQINV